MTTPLPNPILQGPSTEHTLLICTVGGTPDPIVTSLLHWRPAAVRFIVSHQVRSHVDLVLHLYAQQAGTPLAPGCWDCVEVFDAQDFDDLIRTLRTLTAKVLEWSSRSALHRVAVDFTGGTKCMSAALALTARRWPCTFSYVGGQRRSKGGVGVVESGAEQVLHGVNPFNALGYQAAENAVTVFNHGGYAAAADILQRAINQAADPTVKRELATLMAVIDAYAAWDRFDHREACRRFNDALRNANDLAAIFPDPQPLIHRLKQHRRAVEQLADPREPTIAWLDDLLANARRRACEKRFDDAVARLYRAFEALAQITLRHRHRIMDTKTVPLDALPDGLRSKWQSRSRDGSVMLGLRDAYELLQSLDDPLGTGFFNARLGDETSPLTARNQSILAHGFAAVGQSVYDHLEQAWRQLRLVGDAGPSAASSNQKTQTDASHSAGNELLDWRLPACR